jgi:hypothetical protein
MKRFIILILLTICLVFSCGPSYVLTNDFNYKFNNFRQLDSVCTVERLPKNWAKYTPMVMYSDSTSFEQYVYIRRTDSTEVIYTITDLDSLWRIKKKTVQIYKR